MVRNALGRVFTVILGGGRGSRLYPLTRDRAKPAVSLGGKYRLIDVPVSNAINSGYRDIAVLTQFNSASLNTHVAKTYQFDAFGEGSVEVFAAQQTEEGGEWFEGTADAVRKLFRRRPAAEFDHVLVLSGDHLYRMDYRRLLERHVSAGADVTVSVLPVPRADCSGFGVLQTSKEGRIIAFREKPRTDGELALLAPPAALREPWGLGEDEFLASMGVYVFRRDVLLEALADPGALDFGKDILPRMIATHAVHAFLFRGYWRDIGTISTFFEANLALADAPPPFRFYERDAPIYSRRRILPATRVVDARVSRSVLSEGSILVGAEIDHCVIGVRALVEGGTRMKDVILMGADFYPDLDPESLAPVPAPSAARASLGIGRDCRIERAIVDKNARVGDGCVLVGDPARPDEDGDGWYVRDGIVIVPKGAILPPGTVA